MNAIGIISYGVTGMNIHGKSPCDGIGGTAKCLITQDGLQCPASGQIFTARDMSSFCEKEIITNGSCPTCILQNPHVGISSKFVPH